MYAGAGYAGAGYAGACGYAGAGAGLAAGAPPPGGMPACAVDFIGLPLTSSRRIDPGGRTVGSSHPDGRSECAPVTCAPCAGAIADAGGGAYAGAGVDAGGRLTYDGGVGVCGALPYDGAGGGA